MNLFISGWAGFREALEDVPADWHFVIPFTDFHPERLKEYLFDSSGKTLVAWSTGGHLVLKELNFFAERFSEIIIVSGFRRFTDYVSSKIVRRMIQRIKSNPEDVLKEFLVNSGVKPVFPKSLDLPNLIEGLLFLLDSSVQDINLDIHIDITLIHGAQDRIVPVDALKELKEIINQAKSIIVEGPHWVGFSKILEVRASARG